MIAERDIAADTAAPIRAETLPGPSPLLAFRYLQSGNFRGGPEWMLDVARQYGKIAQTRAFGGRLFLVSDPEMTREILVTKARSFQKSRGNARLKPLLGEGLLTSEQPLHLRQRRLAQPAFHRDRIAGYGRTMIERTQAWLDGFHGGERVDIDSEMMNLTMKIAADTLFKTDVSEKADAIAASLKVLMGLFPFVVAPFGEHLENLPFGPMRRYREARDLLDRVIYDMIDERRRDGEDRGDLLSMLMLARDEDGSAMDDRQVRDESITIFLAGHETTAISMTWVWYALALYPDVERRLHAELDAVLGDREPVPADYPKLPYAQAIFRETLRLYPPAYRMGRRTVEEVRIGDYVLPNDASVFVSPFAVQRDPSLYPSPDVFMPERWLGEVEAPRFSFFPFGGGSRLCIGEAFAWMEGVLAMATIARRFSLRRADAEPIGFNPSVTLRPDGPVRMELVARG